MTCKRALLIVDDQLGFRDISAWGPSRSNPKYEGNVTQLLSAFRKAEGSPLIVHILHHSVLQDSPLHPSKSTSAVDPRTAPIGGEPVVIKSVNSAFIGTNLEGLLRYQQVNKVYILGITTDHCVSTTTRMAGNLHVADLLDEDGSKSRGEIVLIGDATACFQKTDGSWDAETIHGVHVESLKEFATVMTTAEVLAELSGL